MNVPTPPPSVVTTSTVTISGTGEPGANIQIFVNNADVGMKKVNSAGKFTVDIATPAEGSYEVVLAFSKKDLAGRRITYQFVRQWSEADMLKEIKSQAIKPGYNTLISKMKGYEGRIMGYQCYLVDVTESGADWIARMAITKRGNDYISNILVICKEKPNIPIGGQVMMYGTCVGMSLPEEDADDQTSYPCFELLLFASLD